LGFGGLKPYLDNNKISIKQNVGNVLGYGHFWGRLAPKAPPLLTPMTIATQRVGNNYNELQ